MSSTGSGASLLQRARSSRRCELKTRLDHGARRYPARRRLRLREHHLGVNTDTDQMFFASLPWRQRAMALDRAFPQFQGLLVAVVDANVPEEAEETARDLTRALAADHKDFSMGEPARLLAVTGPDGRPA
jgi:hypothetical protein